MHGWGHRWGSREDDDNPLRGLGPLAGWTPSTIAAIAEARAVEGTAENPGGGAATLNKIAQLTDLYRGLGFPVSAGETASFLETGVADTVLLKLLFGDTSSGGGAGRTQFASEAALDEAQTRKLLIEAGLLQPAFDLTRRSTEAGIARDQEARYLDALNLKLDAELGRGQLSLNQLVAAANMKTSQRESERLEKALEETIRANKEKEEEDRRRRLLDTASTALSSYLRAQEAADARKIAALQETRAFLPSMVDPSQEFFSGMGPSGALAEATRAFGLPFTPSPIQHLNVNPQGLANAPGVSQDIMDLINALGLNQPGVGV